MNKHHFPGSERTTLCGHSATEQEWQWMQRFRRRQVTCRSCLTRA